MQLQTLKLNILTYKTTGMIPGKYMSMCFNAIKRESTIQVTKTICHLKTCKTIVREG